MANIIYCDRCGNECEDVERPFRYAYHSLNRFLIFRMRSDEQFDLCRRCSDDVRKVLKTNPVEQ